MGAGRRSEPTAQTTDDIRDWHSADAPAVNALFKVVSKSKEVLGRHRRRSQGRGIRGRLLARLPERRRYGASIDQQQRVPNLDRRSCDSGNALQKHQLLVARNTEYDDGASKGFQK